jgi:hypothetical protein
MVKMVLRVPISIFPRKGKEGEEGVGGDGGKKGWFFVTSYFIQSSTLHSISRFSLQLNGRYVENSRKETRSKKELRMEKLFRRILTKKPVRSPESWKELGSAGEFLGDI